MAFFLYNLILLILTPVIALYFLYRIFVSKKSKDSWREQMGFVTLPDEIFKSNPIWIHAVSVGESVASASVVTELKKTLPDSKIVVSTTTSPGRQMAEKTIRDADAFIYYPFDVLPFVAASLKSVQPKIFASTDTEIWPNFRHIARKYGVKSAIINGTVSDKTINGAKKIPWVYKWTLSNIDMFCMQSRADADRIIDIGADSANVIVTGNCKADQAAIDVSEDDLNQLSETYFPGYTSISDLRVFVAGSSNPGEDEPVIDAMLIARKNHPGLRMIIAPRQVERKNEIVEIAQSKGLKCGWRSDPNSITGKENIIILDTFGELAKVYAIADVSFVGGSLIPRGCHSILQPISMGKPVFFGQYTFKAKDLVSQAKSYGVGFEIKDGAELGLQMSNMLSDSVLLESIKANCKKMMDANLGASKRTAEALVSLYKEAAR